MRRTVNEVAVMCALRENKFVQDIIEFGMLSQKR